MAVFGSLLFNRSLKQFLASKDPESKAFKDLADRLRDGAADNLEKLLEVIPDADEAHHDVLKDICQQQISLDSEDRFLDNLNSDTTVIRDATKHILTDSQQINPMKMLKRLQEPDAAHTEILDILEFQKSQVAPELLVKNALRIEPSYASRLFDMAISEAERTDMSAIGLDPESIENIDLKLKYLRFLTAVNQPESARLIIHLLGDSSKIVVLETLKSLKNMTTEFDPSPIVRFIPSMRGEDADTAFQIVEQKITGKTLRCLTMLMAGKNEEQRERSCQIAVDRVDSESLASLLEALDVHEWFGKEQAVKCLLNHGDNKLFEAASKLTDHSNEFVKNTAQQLAANQIDFSGDLNEFTDAVLNEDWQVRDRAIENLSKSNNRNALELLLEVVKQYPDSAISVLRAVVKLGFSKGLEIASKCLRMKEAAIQREALLTIDQIVTHKHADNVRSGIIQVVPKLQVTVRDTAREVIESITRKFKLPALKLDDDALFETRLLKVEENKANLEATAVVSPSGTAQEVASEKTEVVSFQHIEELKPGDYWMDRFKIVKEVGRGAMGRVMLVNDETVGENTILKFMHPELTTDGKARERFLRELKYSRKISHPNVIRIHDFLVSDGISAISMEYFDSKGLDYLIKHELIHNHDEALNILYQVSDGMWEAHQKEVIHRDLKPSNILVNNDGLAKVLDFGIASASSESDATLTKTGMIIGTPAYLSPERAKGMEADHRADIYALGIIAYAMFNGSAPYKGEPMSLLFQHIEGKATPLHRLDKGVSTGVSMLVEKMMAVDIDRRYQSMKDVRDTLKELMN